MKKGIVLAISFLTLMAFAGTALAADKFGSVDIMRIASEYNKAKDYSKALEDKAKAAEDEVSKKVDEFKGLKDKINLLGEKEKAAKQSELEDKYKKLQEFQADKARELRKKDFENSKELAEDIRAAIKQYAQKDGYTIVFDDRSLIYPDKGLDVTDKVLEILNKNYAGKK